MDIIDKGILGDLRANCRITYRELSIRYGITSSAIKKRVRKLEESGIIHGYTITLSHAMIGANVLFGLLKTDGSQDEEEFVRQIGKNEKVLAAAAYTSGNYALIAEYRNSQELYEIGAFLRSFGCVENIELHQLLETSGSKMKFSKLHLRVLRYLINDPRMPIAALAEKSGLTARRARKVVNELLQSNAVSFRALLELGVAASISFLMRVTYNEKDVEYQSLVDWLKETFAHALWDVYISVEGPLLYLLFAVNTLSELTYIAQQVRRFKHVQTVQVIINKYHQFFPGLRVKILNQLIQDSKLE